MKIFYSYTQCCPLGVVKEFKTYAKLIKWIEHDWFPLPDGKFLKHNSDNSVSVGKLKIAKSAIKVEF